MRRPASWIRSKRCKCRKPCGICTRTSSAAVSAAVADSGRPQADKDKDSGRKPAESVAFAGIKKGDKVADLLAGGGYFTRIFSKVVGDSGMVYATGFPPRPGAPSPSPLEQ